MNKQKNTLNLSALIGALIVQPVSFVQAQATNAEEIIVTATKREQSIYEVPIAISAFNGDDLAKQGVVDFVDIGKFVPNLNITQFSAGHNSSANAFIRGIGLQDHLITTDPGVSVYVDGVYLGRQVGQNWSLTNIERIEVLRGPQGTLYGRNSIGGAINIITKTPGKDPGSKVSIEAGTRDRLNGDFYSDVAVSDSLSFSFTGGYKSRGGVGEFTNLPNAGLDVGENQEVYGRASFNYHPNDDFNIVISADANDGKGGLRPYTTLIDELPNGALAQAGLTRADLPNDPYDNATGQADVVEVSNSASGVSGTVSWNWSPNLSSKFIASNRTSDYKAGLDDDSAEVNFLSFPEVGSADQSSYEFQFNGEFGAFDFVSGLYYFEEEGENFQPDYFFFGGPFEFFLSQETTSRAAFFNMGYALNERLRLSGGVRYTEDEKNAQTDVGTGLISASDEWEEVSWDLSASYHVSDDLNVYASIQNGYQSGQFPARPFCLFSDPDCFVASDNVTAVNYELGLKGQPRDNLSMSAAFFYTEYSDLPYQVSTTVDGGFSTVNLVVEQTSTGFEWESTLHFSEDFLLHTTLGLIDVDVTEEGGVSAVAPLTPEVTFSISPEYTIALNSGASINLRADYSYRDEMFGEPSDDPGRFTQIDSRELINVNITYFSSDDTWSAALYGRNMTDERYDDARLNTGDYVLRMLSNDPSEFGIRLSASY